MTGAPIRLVLVAFALTLLGACRDHRSPTTPIDDGHANQTLAIVGEASISGPGETTQLTVMLSTTGGASEDVTARCHWNVVPPDVADVTNAGVVEASRYGTARITASYPHSQLSASFDLRVAPAETFLVQGVVRTLSGILFGGARVSVESAAGGFDTTTSLDGSYALPARGNAVLRVEEVGYRPLRQRMSVGHDAWMDLVLESDGSTLSGLYDVTITASSFCELPSPAVQRTFDAIVEEIRGEVIVTAQSGDFVSWATPGFTGRRDGDRVTFEILDSYNAEFNLVESVTGVGNLCFAGTATGKVRGSDVVATFDGTIRVEGTESSCTSASHRLEMIRTGGSG